MPRCREVMVVLLVQWIHQSGTERMHKIRKKNSKNSQFFLNVDTTAGVDELLEKKQKLFLKFYSVKQSDRNSSKTDIFHQTATYEQHVKIMTFARHEYGRVGVFRIKM